MTAVERIRIDFTSLDGALRITVQGQVDQSTVHHLRESLAEARGDRVEVDLHGVTFFGTEGARALAEANRLVLDRGARLIVVDPPPVVSRVLQLSGLDQILQIEHSGARSGP